MVRIRQNSFLAGQLDFEMMGRQDFQKYQKGASRLMNFNILKRGGITKRQGFDRIINLREKDGSGNFKFTDGDGNPLTEETKIRLVPFGYKKNNGFVLMFVPGKCYAICTVAGSIYMAWEVNYTESTTEFQSAFGSKDGTDSEIGEFDYAQCGYKLFLAHSKHFPSVIETTEDQVDAAIEAARSGTQSDSPFKWRPLDIGGINNGIPSIISAFQERIAPSGDTAGGTYTEKYKASAVFDDVETKPCSEFYNESCIKPVNITSTTGGTCVQRSSSTTAGYKSSSSSTTYNAKMEPQSTNSGSNSIPQVTNTSAVYSNRVKGSCSGTKYYLPWVESQSIKLTIRADPSFNKLPDRINIYKKSYGYYGLIGTMAMGSVSFASAQSGATALLNSEIVSSDKNSRKYDKNTNVVMDPSKVKDNAIHSSAISVSTSQTLRIDAGGTIGSSSRLKLALGCGRCAFDAFFVSGSTTYYNRPYSAVFSFKGNTCSSATVNVHYRYTNDNGQDVQAVATGTWNNIPTITDVKSGTYAKESSKYSTFAKNYLTKFSEWSAGIGSAVKKAEFDLHSLSYDSEKCTIEYVEVIPLNNELIVSGVDVTSVKGEVEFVDNNITPNTSITPIDSEFDLPFNGKGNFPATVCISQQRLVWGSSDRQPETVWMSAIGDFGNYVEHEVQKDDDSFVFDMPVTRFAKLNHLVEMRQLIAFNSACEWLINSTSTTKGIAYDTIQARPQSYAGSNARLKPLICNNSVIFSERTGQTVRRFAYDIANDGFAGRDMSILSSSIFEHNTIVDWTYQQHPFSTVWCVLSDGSLASFTMMEEQDIMAWATHRHGCGRVKAIATTYAMSPSLAEVKDASDDSNIYDLATHEEIFALVANDDGELWVERMRVRSKERDTIYNSLCMDSVRVLNQHNGYEPLEGDGLIYIDGVTGKVITRDEANTKRLTQDVYEGYPFESVFTSVYPILGTGVGQGQFDLKNITNLGLRLEASCGGEIESAGKPGDKEPIRYDDEAGEDKSPVIVDGMARFFNLNAANGKPIGVNTRDGRITIVQDRPYPFTLISYEADYATEGEARHGYAAR